MGEDDGLVAPDDETYNIYNWILCFFYFIVISD